MDSFLKRFRKRPRLGDILIKSGVITEEMLHSALNHKKKAGIRFGDSLVELNFITEEVMKQTLCHQLNIPFITFDSISIDLNLSKMINKRFALKHRIVPIAKIGNTVTLAMDDPTDLALAEELQCITGFKINIVTSTKAAILDAYTRLYEDSIQVINDLRIQLTDEIDDNNYGVKRYIGPEESRYPRAHARGTLRLKFEAQLSFIYFFLKFNVSFNNLFINSYCGGEKTRRPEFITPIYLFHPFKLFSYFSTRIGFYFSYDHGNRISWRYDYN